MNLLEQIYDPGSPMYHQFLSVEEFTERFGPSQADYDAVISFAEKNGLTVTGTSPNRMVVDVEGRVVDIEKAFHVNHEQLSAPDGKPCILLSRQGTDSRFGCDVMACSRPR